MKKCVIILVAVCTLPGCFGKKLSELLDNHQEKHPGTQYITLHESGDESKPIVGVAVDANADGVPDLDPDTKEIVLVPGSRQVIAHDYALADELDAAAMDLITLIGSLCGAGGLAGVIGGIWGRRKPVRKLAETQIKVRGIVQSVDAVLKSDQFNEDTVRAIREILAAVQETRDGVEDYVKEVKAEIEAVKAQE